MKQMSQNIPKLAFESQILQKSYFSDFDFRPSKFNPKRYGGVRIPTRRHQNACFFQKDKAMTIKSHVIVF